LVPSGISLQPDGSLRVSGDLVFSSVAALLQRGISLLDSGGEPRVIDLSDVEHCDSAGLALLLEWLDYGRAKKFSVSFRGLPPGLLRIAGLSNATSLLTVAAD
jgi:phospholipid transport system transporter-binding protein